MKKVTLISLGCAKNLVDSEVMLGYMKKAARYAFVREPERADIVIVNTCGFIQPARDEANDLLKKLSRLKKRWPQKKIIVTGCYVRKDKSFLEKTFPCVDGWLGVGGFDKIVDVLEGRTPKEDGRTFLYSHSSPRIFSTPPGWAYLKVSEGCSHRCSFCSIPLIKGPYRSRPFSSVVEEAKAMAGRGIKEINLISQDTTYFGRDRGIKNGLARLLRKLLAVRGLAWIRILYGYPEEISDEILELLQEDKICPYLDIPFQHAEPRIVKNMKRRSDGRKGLELIEKIRNKVPDAAFRTSLIVGFPGEGAKEFQTLLQFVREARFNHLGVFTYSPESGTPAHALADNLTSEEKERRRNEIMELQSGISLSHNRAFVGRTMDLLPEGPLKKGILFAGRTKYQAPEVDGVVLIEDAGAHVQSAPDIKKVEITGAEIYDLRGRWIS